ncbi:unnamed protein product, partial [Rotaria sp. Silwood2]
FGMPKGNKRSCQLHNGRARRWSKTKISGTNDPSNVDNLDINDPSNVEISDANDSSNINVLDANNPSDVDDLDGREDVDDEYHMDTDDRELNFGEKLLVSDIADLAEM